MLRVRYRAGVPIGPYGFPGWTDYAYVVVDLPPGRSRLDAVLEANAIMARRRDPLWTDTEAPGTPVGWTWAHLPGGQSAALVPIELHGAFRHAGGRSTSTAGRDTSTAGRGTSAGRTGTRGQTAGRTPRIRAGQRLSDEVLDRTEERLGFALPTAYRDYLARTNGGQPVPPAAHPDFDFLVDQPFFGLARADWHQDLVYANAWFGDRFTPDFLAIGYVQGGLLAIKADTGSIWFWDDDDPRDSDTFTATDICDRLLYRCADTFDAFWYALFAVAAP